MQHVHRYYLSAPIRTGSRRAGHPEMAQAPIAITISARASARGASSASAILVETVPEMRRRRPGAGWP